VREAVAEDAPVLVRFSGSDWLESGWDVEQTATVAAWVRDLGVDLVDISSGGLLPAPITVGPGYQAPLAARVREATGMPVSAVGLITEPAQAEQLLQDGTADVVSLGREMMRDPHFALRAAHELGVDVDYWPAQYRRARWR
jgi:2,4-dienoyl-CoA reductase-like NADH-dependent reductase (Old Yellow Enzyme family)